MSKVETYEIQIQDVWCYNCPQFNKKNGFCDFFKERLDPCRNSEIIQAVRLNACISVIGKSLRTQRYKIRISKIKSEVNHEK